MQSDPSTEYVVCRRAPGQAAGCVCDVYGVRRFRSGHFVPGETVELLLSRSESFSSFEEARLWAASEGYPFQEEP